MISKNLEFNREQSLVLDDQRLNIQQDLDGKKTLKERNFLGQFSTPPTLARQIVSASCQLLDKHARIRFLDPAFGTGAFYSALLSEVKGHIIDFSEGYEIDPHYGIPTKAFWSDFSLNLVLKDFTKCLPPSNENEKFNFLICNPPYVRHHHISMEEKKRLQGLSAEMGLKVDGLTGFYCHYMLITQKWLQKNAISAWLIPSEFMDVNYGQTIKSYLLDKVRLLRIHRFDPSEVQFQDALVSSAIVWLQNAPPTSNHEVIFSFGGSISAPKISRNIPENVLRAERKWTRFPVKESRSNKARIALSELFSIKRGIATGDNNFFVLNAERAKAIGVPKRFLTPILPSPRFLAEIEIQGDSSGNPKIESPLFLLNCNLPASDIQEKFPALYQYLESGRKTVGEGYLCKSRKAWYFQEVRTPPPILCTYIGRTNEFGKAPFRFILNESNAIATNSYLLLYPTHALERFIRKDPRIVRKLWEGLKSLPPSSLLDEGRVYGGGMHKLEPKELSNVDVSEIVLKVIPEFKIETSDQEVMLLQEKKVRYRTGMRIKVISKSKKLNSKLVESKKTKRPPQKRKKTKRSPNKRQ